MVLAGAGRLQPFEPSNESVGIGRRLRRLVGHFGAHLFKEAQLQPHHPRVAVDPRGGGGSRKTRGKPVMVPVAECALEDVVEELRPGQGRAEARGHDYIARRSKGYANETGPTVQLFPRWPKCLGPDVDP